MAKACRGYVVNDVFISSLICRRNKFLNKKVQRVILLLKLMCEENGYIYIDNGHIEVGDLWQDGSHVSEYGKAKLSWNFIYFLKTFYGLLFYTNVLKMRHTNFELPLPQSNSEVLNTNDCQCISTADVLNML